MYEGIDVSVWQGDIDWQKAAKEIDFAIIRAGYADERDRMYPVYAKGCKDNNIPFGFYWFSYALNTEDAINEANLCCDVADKYELSLPIAFDYEGDSYSWAIKQGKKPSPELVCNIAIAFMERVKQRGYEPMLYTNLSYIDMFYEPLLNKYKLWLAQWTGDKPKYNCYMWQYSDGGFIDGIGGLVDHNKLYGDFTDKFEPQKEVLCKVEIKQIAKGDTGNVVKTCQALLMTKFGISCGDYGCDGVFGVNTDAAVRTFQKKFGLVIDGIVGVNTWGAMLK